ncbi:MULTISPECIES: RAMP superfamily CRISPR-associated protein [Nocardia]|uniref:RAMP superfamily CRISPR-associated protein n=1 Tax=Nocardia TaxID=1817 RepID=UPI00156218CC|nr:MULTISPECIES: RAMP superfamily CRISPR-associated protein [Nocardia]MBF6189452.1 DNA repair protein [Nocardia farcinica]MBF6294627.1 DNA repair protein [Nocardia farcinica]MBF6314013.1 DNA repair protein [Nocardia farcinica]MBF6381799.1 DNA repair protein [Nocardia farcinica]MBF6388061.1 DNA repair protein [Nocardia farcinica]
MKSTLITVRLRLDTSGGVTAPEEQRIDVTTNPTGESRTRNTRPLRRDPAGRVHLPGSTVAGSLRAHCAHIGELAGAFGPAPGAKVRTASPIQVLGTRTRPNGPPGVRGRTAIDRTRAAARNHTLHSTETLAPGTEFDIHLRWDDAADIELTALLDALRHWKPILGAGASVGAGRARPTGLAHRTYDLHTTDGLTAWLAITGPDDYPAPTAFTVDPTPYTTRTLRITTALHIGTGTTRVGDKEQEIAEIVRSGDDYLIPGTTLKGVLRSRIEYICRVLDAPACDTDPCGACRPCLLFGHGSPGPDLPPARARIAVHDAIVRDPIREQRQHVAIDRFTGGAHDQLLFTHDVLTAGEFDLVIEPLTDIDTFDRMLLDAAVADLHDGLIGLGARTTAGYGTVTRTDHTPTEPPDLTHLPAPSSAEIS